MNIIIGNAWPYANGSLHLGRIAVLLPGDVLARYHRMLGDDVIFISGTDCHGIPVTMRAKEERITPLEICNKYHKEFQECFEKIGFSFDIFTRTHSDYHKELVGKFIIELYQKGYIYEKKVEQDFCGRCNEILADRNIEGICPYCGAYATGEQCDKCSEIFDSVEILDKKCKTCKSVPCVKEEKHLFFTLSKFENDIRRLMIRKSGWRDNAEKIVNRYLKEGLRDKAVTRVFDWGIDVPIDGYEDKKIFVWIEAIMGYITASMKFLEGKNEDWKDYWQGEDSRIYFVHGKDNIPFHSVIFPAIISGFGIKNPNIRVLSSEYLKLEGKQFSSVRNWVLWAEYITERYNIDAVRYYLLLNSPEKKDADFTWRGFINTNNNDLVCEFGNLVNRTIKFIKKNFNSQVPRGYVPPKLKSEILNLYFEVGDKIEEGKFYEALRDIFKLIKEANRYFDESKPWIVVKKDKERCEEILYICLQYIVNISNLLNPFIPFTCDKIGKAMGISKPVWSYLEKKDGIIQEIDILFERIDVENIKIEMQNLKYNKF